MKFDVPKIVKLLNVGEYAPELEAVKICVWVNPPRALLLRHDAMIEGLVAAVRGSLEQEAGASVDPLRREMCAVFAELWSAGSEVETHWSAEAVDRLITEMADTDPQLWPWLRKRTLEMIREHRETAKKG